MAERSAEIVWLALGGYLAVRLLIAPGLAALWPPILARLVGVRAREDRRRLQIRAPFSALHRL